MKEIITNLDIFLALLRGYNYNNDNKNIVRIKKARVPFVFRVLETKGIDVYMYPT